MFNVKVYVISAHLRVFLFFYKFFYYSGHFYKTTMRKISESLSINRIKDIKSTTKNDVLIELCEMLTGVPEVSSLDTLIKAVSAREAIISTGIGMGIAIPHAKISTVADIVIAIGRSLKGIDFESLDGMPVYFFILIAASDTQSEEFLKILAKIGTFFNHPENKKKLLNAESPKEIYSLFKQIDA